MGLVPAFVSGAAEGESAGQELRSGHTALAAHCPRKTVWWGWEVGEGTGEMVGIWQKQKTDQVRKGGSPPPAVWCAGCLRRERGWE